MPTWLIQILIKMAEVVGIPYLMEKLKFIPAGMWDLIKEILKHLEESKSQTAAVSQLRDAVKKCSGVACPIDIV